jgi:DNA mismatch repair protein MutS2
MVPESTQLMIQNLQNLEFEEKNEIIKILKDLTNQIKPFGSLLKKHLDLFIYLDVVGAKAKFAKEINACLPKINTNKQTILKNAVHPLLYLSNKKEGILTVPQSITLDNEQRIIVISGPNAGGKSITLKTIGLLQVLLQSAILIPVHEKSELSFFNVIITDIGDNQSIENHLSTYSYRLKNMRNFLKKCNDQTLFLIDEFGTGSDPELGGALAEIFLEEFYQSNSYGIITTHYANLKVLATELPNVVNANMQFDTRTLKPLFQLEIGQAGSSFTFEVAQKNGIPYRLINRAKKKVEREKLRLDKTISKLQTERNKLRKITDNLESQKNKIEDVRNSLSKKEQKLNTKIESFQELYDNNQKMLSYGRTVNEMVNRYFQNNNLKHLMASFKKWILIEKSNYTKKLSEKIPIDNKQVKKINLQETKAILKVKNKLNPSKRDLRILKKQKEKEAIEAKRKLKIIELEVLKQVAVVRNNKSKIAKKNAFYKANYNYKIDDKVRIVGTLTVGVIQKVEKNQVHINFGNLITKAKKIRIELVE